MFKTRYALTALLVTIAVVPLLFAAEKTKPSPTKKPEAEPKAAPGKAKPTSQPSSLRAAADAKNVLIGAAIFPEGLKNKPYANTLAKEFNFITAENVMKWALIQPEPDKWNFAPADELVEFAVKNKMKVKGHCLLWHEALPKYVHKDMTADQLRDAMRKHIFGEVGHFKGKVVAWDVVNEAVDDKEGMRKSIFFEKLGEGYIAEAFHLAHKADPDALLIYNDFGGEGLGGKSDRIYELVKKLVDQKVPIGGVGLQMHISATNYPKPEDIAANVRRLAALGLKVNISEMDVQIKDVKGELPERLKVQQQVYHDIIAACVNEKNFMAVTFWGFTDAHSWVDHFFGEDDPLPFDEQYKKKPAYDGILEAMLGQ